MPSLHTKLVRLRRRVIGLAVTASAMWAMLAAIAIVLLAAWLDLLWELPSEARSAVFGAAVIAGLTLFCLLMLRLVRAVRATTLARRLDSAGRAEGRIYTGWELSHGSFGPRGVNPPPMSDGLARIAVERASAEAAPIPLHRAAPWRPLARSFSSLAVTLLAIGLLILILPNLSRTQWNRLWSPRADVPPFSLTAFDVKPGSTSVVYGSELEIRAAVRGAPIDQLELVLETDAGEQALPMFQESGGAWRAVLSKVVEPAHYFVRAVRARSLKYNINVLTVPLLENVRVRVTPPLYAAKAPYDGPVPKDGISGLKNTNVQIFLRSNRPLKGGTVLLSGSGKENRLSMLPLEPGGQEVTGTFQIEKDGTFECRVVDEAGQLSQQSCSGNVTLLADERPFVRILQPEKTSLATPSAALPIAMSAEDDCGITRLQLYRSLNDSRPLPAEVAVPAKIIRRADGSVILPLDQYGLTPGDVIKLFARVEDNDPAGQKGSESAITTVRIISDEDLERMIRTREGIQSLVGKYYAARRQLETMASQLDSLRKKLKDLPPGDKSTQQIRAEIQRLEEAIRKQAADIRKSAKRLTGFDLDKNLMPQIEEVLQLTENMAKALEQLSKEHELINSKLGDRLEKLAQQLAEQRKEFEQQAVKPLEYLEAVFPLMVDQNRFVQIVLWQQDLTDRMAALEGRDGEDNPSLKARMRDLEQEQWQIRAALAQLLDDIHEHSQQLPDKPELEKLRETAQAFSSKVRASGATVAMVAAEAALSEFTPTRAHEKAKEAADILMKFLSECKGMGNCAGNTLIFQPRLCKNLGNTVNQLLAGMGMGAGNGMDGFGSVGLYGALPTMFGAEGNIGNARRSVRGPHAANRHSQNPDEIRPDDAGQPGSAGGTSEGSVPAQYRRQVGQYFERVAEETGEKGQ